MRRVPEGPRNPQKPFTLYICYPYWKPNLGIRLQPQSYSFMCFPHGCFCTRSECIRTGSERRNPAKDQSRFGMVNSKSNSMASFLLTKTTQGRLWTLSGCIFDPFRPQCGDSGGTYVPAGMKVLPPAPAWATKQFQRAHPSLSQPMTEP